MRSTLEDRKSSGCLQRVRGGGWEAGLSAEAHSVTGLRPWDRNQAGRRGCWGWGGIPAPGKRWVPDHGERPFHQNTLIFRCPKNLRFSCTQIKQVHYFHILRVFIFDNLALKDPLILTF